MKDLTTNQKLFSDIVMFLETSVEHPYLKTRDVGSFDELAEALNVRGHLNSRGQKLTGKGITKFISRMSIEEKREAVTSLAIFSTSLLFIIAPISLFFISKYRINKSIHVDNLQDLGYETGNVKL